MFNKLLNKINWFFTPEYQKEQILELNALMERQFELDNLRTYVCKRFDVVLFARDTYPSSFTISVACEQAWIECMLASDYMFMGIPFEVDEDQVEWVIGVYDEEG